MAPVPRNYMLASLSSSDLALVEPHLKTIALPQGDVLLQQDVHMAHFYFPTDGMVSLVAVLEDGGSIEVAAIGREGVVGAALANGTGNAPMTAIVQVAGNASRIEAGKFHEAARESATFRGVVAHHNEALIAQIIRTVACNGKHVLEARLCRWLLMVRDRVDGETLNLTQEFLGQMLGVQRTSVNLAARTLQEAGLVTYSRGRITIIDRAGLEEAACECYAIGRKHFDRLVSLRNTE
jgi:CRP-like cAMP-binding protein